MLPRAVLVTGSAGARGAHERGDAFDDRGETSANEGRRSDVRPGAQRACTKEYYDAFADVYDDQKVGTYHSFVHDLEVDLLHRYRGRGRILECGCGTGSVAKAAFPEERTIGVDISSEMLVKARDRGLFVSRASVTDLPFADASFSLAYSLKVLPHVPAIGRALREMARVVEPGGHVVAEFYNPLSIRGLVRTLRRPLPTGPGFTDEDVYYRSDRPGKVFEQYVPSGLEIVKERGIRIVTALPIALEVPGLGRALVALERMLADRVPRVGGFYCIVARKPPS